MESFKFDLNAIRVNSEDDFVTEFLKETGDLEVRYPKKQEFFRVHPDEQMRIQTKLLLIDADKKWYLVAKNVWPELSDELTAVTLMVCINDDGVQFLWPMKVSPQGQSNGWNDSALNGATKAVTRWVRLVADITRGRRRIILGNENLPEPEWEAATLSDMIQKAFKDTYIDSLDHHVLKKLRGIL